MSDNKFPFLILDQNKSHIEDDSEFSENEYKHKNFKIQKYEKFKPKPIIKNNRSLRGAENKVKNLLSNFIKNIESESYSREDFKSYISVKNKDKDSISIKKCNKKNSLKNGNYIRTNSFTLNNNNKNVESNNAFHGESTPKSSLFSHMFPKKKVTFNININTANLGSFRKDISKEGNNIFKKQGKKKNSIKINSTFKTNDFLKRTSSYTEIIKKNKISSLAENIKGNNIMGKISKKEINRPILKKTKTKSYGQNNILNFKNDGFVLMKNINETKEHKKKRKSILKNFANNIYYKNNHAKKNKNKSNVFNDSYHNSMLSENSDCKMIKNSIEIKSNNFDKERNSFIYPGLKKSSTVINREMPSSLISNKNSIDFTDITYKNSGLKSTIKPNKASDLKNSIEIKKFKRSETSIFDNNLFMKKPKFHRLDTIKSLKEQIKKSIILRPEEIQNPQKDEESISKTSSISKKKNRKKNNDNNLKLYKNKNSSKSYSNIVKIKNLINNYNLGIINKQEIMKKNKSNKNTIRIKDINQFTEQTTSVKKLMSENDTQESIKTEKKSSSKSASFEEYSMNSIKRKNTMYIEKYRIITHKGIIYDSLDDEEIDDQEDINSLYFDPNSVFILYFDSILFIVTILSLCEVPLYLALKNEFCRYNNLTYVDVINLVIESLYVLDLFFGFFRAYYNWEEQLITKNRYIIKHYLTGWFLFDLMASVPIYSINKVYEPICSNDKFLTKYYNVILDDLHYLLICNRLFKVIKIFFNNQAWKILSNKLNDNWTMTVNIFLVLAALNYTACLYIFIARNSYPNWILHSNLDSQPFSQIYICSIYILIMALTTVGYGDITCYSFSERIFQLLLLIIGIMAYSWLISSFSNYIKKLNEKSADYEKKKSILDEIKVNNPNLPDELYERILRYLKFKNFHEKKLKDIIFDCLPVALKNNLISEMYKPIIKNFIFFKNFQNTDFIVRVILSFKPIMAYKNDILVNEGDMIEDIMFVKRGVLSVELPINMTNPQENINKYFNMPLLKIEKGPNIQKIGNSTIIPEQDPKIKNLINSINEPNKNLHLNYTSSFGTEINSISFENKRSFGRKKTIKIETTYVKILGIRENEHFGDVLMFLEQRSPLRLRVRSKKCELFFLKKMDAVKISTSYPNIWKRINKKSIFNFEQIKRSIRKIVELYCSVKKVGSISDEMSDEILGKELGIKESLIGLHPQNYDLNNSALKTKRNSTIRKIQSLKDIKVKNYNIIFGTKDLKEDYFQINIKDIEKRKKNSLSPRVLKRNFELISNNEIRLSSFSSSSCSSSSMTSPINKSNNQNQNNNDNIKDPKLLEVFNGNYKFYRKSNGNNNRHGTIISEETEKESTLKYTNSIQNLSRISNIKKFNFNSITMKKSLSDDDMHCIKEEEELKNNNLSYQKHNSSSLSNFDDSAKSENIQNNASNINSYEKEINIEIYPGEEIKFNKDENLLYKKIDFNTKDNCNDFKDIQYKNSKLEKLLKSFEDESQSQSKKDKNLNSKENSNRYLSDLKENDAECSKISNKDSYSDKTSIIRNNKIICKSNQTSNYVPSPINNTQQRTNWDSNILSINNDISLRIEASYENYNLISGDILIKNKSLQTKLKNYLLDETLNFSRFNTNTNFLKKTNSLADSIKNKSLFQSTIGPNKRFTSIINNKNIITNIQRIKTRKKKSNNSLMSKRSKTINSNSQRLGRTSSFYENNINKIRKAKNKFQTGIGSDLFGNKLRKKKIGSNVLNFKNNNTNINSATKIQSFNTNISNLNNSSKDLQKKLAKKRRNSVVLNFPNNKSNKKKDNLLSLINFNIQKSNLNLNNPDEFYSNYFNFLLEGEIEKNNQKNNNNNNQSFLKTSGVDYSKNKKDKIIRNRSSIIK